MLLSELARVSLPAKALYITYIRQLLLSASPLPGGLPKKKKKKGSCLEDILVSSLQVQVICDIQRQAPGLQPPTLACEIRKAIRSHDPLLAKYFLSLGADP